MDNNIIVLGHLPEDIDEIIDIGKEYVKQVRHNYVDYMVVDNKTKKDYLTDIITGIVYEFCYIKNQTLSEISEAMKTDAVVVAKAIYLAIMEFFSLPTNTTSQALLRYITAVIRKTISENIYKIYDLRYLTKTIDNEKIQVYPLITDSKLINDIKPYIYTIEELKK